MASAHPGPSRHLPRGRSALDADAAATVRRERLRGAVVALMGEQGYGATTVHDIATPRRGLDPRPLRALRRQAATRPRHLRRDRRARPAARCGRGPSPTATCAPALAAVLDGVVDAVLAAPAAARLAVVDVVAVGPPGVQRRRSLITGLYELLRDAVTREGKPLLPEAALAVLAGGTVARPRSPSALRTAAPAAQGRRGPRRLGRDL